MEYGQVSVDIRLVRLYNLATTISAKTCITYITRTRYRNLQLFRRPMFLGPVFFTDISCHTTNTKPHTLRNFFFPLSPLSHHASSKMREFGKRPLPDSGLSAVATNDSPLNTETFPVTP